MNLKVKIKTGDLSIVYIDVPDSITLDELVKELVREGHVSAEFSDSFPQDEALNSLFDRTGQLKVSASGIELTLTKKRGGGQKVETIASKLNYQIFLPTVQLYRELVTANHVKFQTTFFVQIDKATYLVRHNKNDVELFDFGKAFLSLNNGGRVAPRSRVLFKTRDELSMSEMAFIRSISFPVKERKNPIIETNLMTQKEIDWMTDVLDKVTQVIKHFSQHNTEINRSDEDFPTYVFQNGKPTIGFVKQKQLVKIAESGK